MKKVLALFLAICLCFSVSGCGGNSYDDDYDEDAYDENDYDYDDDDDDDYDDDDYSYFSNDYGSKTTKCMKSGCNNYIASSGDTAYCVTHSNKCLECYCYIDGDAMYCMDCLSGAAAKNNDDKNNYGHECYVCGDDAYTKYGSYYYCSSCLALVKAFS